MSKQIPITLFCSFCGKDLSDETPCVVDGIEQRIACSRCHGTLLTPPAAPPKPARPADGENAALWLARWAATLLGLLLAAFGLIAVCVGDVVSGLAVVGAAILLWIFAALLLIAENLRLVLEGK